MALDAERRLPGGRCGVSKAHRGERRVCWTGLRLQLHGPPHCGERTLGGSRPLQALRLVLPLPGGQHAGSAAWHSGPAMCWGAPPHLHSRLLCAEHWRHSGPKSHGGAHRWAPSPALPGGEAEAQTSSEACPGVSRGGGSQAGGPELGSLQEPGCPGLSWSENDEPAPALRPAAQKCSCLPLVTLPLSSSCGLEAWALGMGRSEVRGLGTPYPHLKLRHWGGEEMLRELPGICYLLFSREEMTIHFFQMRNRARVEGDCGLTAVGG